MGPIQNTIVENAKVRQVSARAWMQGWMDASTILRGYAARLLPGRTPAGLEISESQRRGFLTQLSFEQFPSVAVEYAIVEESLRTGSKPSAQSFLDFQHGVVALPYVKGSFRTTGNLCEW